MPHLADRCLFNVRTLVRIGMAPIGMAPVAMVPISIALAGLLSAAQASAALEITSTTSTTYAYGFVQQSSEVAGGGDVNSLLLTPPTPGHVGQISINTVSTADADSFYFLLDSYCIGLCSTTATSETVLSLFNNSETETLSGLRFDSVITPGHLARSGDNPTTFAAYYFRVTQNLQNLGPETLFQSLGNVNQDGLSVENFGAPAFNGFHVETFGNAIYADWGATNLNLELVSIGPKETLVLTYYTYLALNAGNNGTGACVDPSACDGAQVAFGDPRRSGGVNRSALFSAALGGESIIGRKFDAFNAPIAVNTVGDPIPDEPNVPPPTTYASILPASLAPTSAVPEPASWAMMAAAFGVIGAALRRRPPLVARQA
jgi:hypothetical protein